MWRGLPIAGCCCKLTSPLFVMEPMLPSLKALFISLFIGFLVTTFVISFEQFLIRGRGDAWLGVFIASLSFLGFFLRLYITVTAHTRGYMILTMATCVAGLVITIFAGKTLPLLLACGCVLGGIAYVFWYSNMPSPRKQLKIGDTLPAFTLRVVDGEKVQSEQLTSQRRLWLFYRGNWCPICTAQIRALAAQYQAFDERGIKLSFVSSQPEPNNVAQAAKVSIPATFYIDPDNQAAKSLGILQAGGLPFGLQILGYGSDVALPTVIVTDASGIIEYLNVAENYRYRPDPELILAEVDNALNANGDVINSGKRSEVNVSETPGG